MLWLLVIVFAYILLAVTSLFDKFLLTGPPNPKIYAFYTGVLGISTVLLIPFVGFVTPSWELILLSFLAGFVFIAALFSFYTALESFEVSREVPAIGAMAAFFTLVLTYVFIDGKSILSIQEIIAFILLVSGGIFIVSGKGRAMVGRLKIAIIAAFLLSVYLVLSKFVYMSMSFWNGFIWMRIGSFLLAFCLIFTKEVRREIFGGHFSFNKKTGTIYFVNQIFGAGALILQNWAIALVPIGLLFFVNALEGVKYLFVLLFSSIVAIKNPSMLKEKFSRKSLTQKGAAVLLIGAGLFLLTKI